MTILQRFRDVAIGLIMLLFSVIFILNPTDDLYVILITILALGLAIKGIKDIIFYFTMAKHMVGGKVILFQGVIILDFALITVSLSDVPKIYILMYLVGIHAFSGVVETLRALEAKRTVDGPWRLKLMHGIIDFTLALACLAYIKQTDVVLIIYGIGLAYSAIMRIIGAFRRTTFVLIE
ncbi:MAG: hypothetical protein IKI75_09770 [Lachnospiraceae bacterium]|nr:hypothetical protein [Lachnospiraceae bacterium]